MSKIELNHIDKFYGNNHVLKDLNLVIDDGEFMTLLGPSGCGKTTTLRVVAGLEKPQNGTITMGDKLVVNAKELFFEEPGKRGLNLVFQSYALWPHMTVFDNVAFGLTVKKLPKPEIEEKVMNALERMQIGGFAKRYPAELSGGQQQRVAIARAIVSEPKVLLLDEPLSNLDAKLRVTMRTEIRKIQQKVGITAIYVTHDQSEAMSISDKIIIMSKGKVEQIGTPREIYYHPNSRFVADFIGEANFLEARVRSASGEKAVIDVVGQELTVNNFAKAGPGDDAVLVIRPEGATLAEQGLLEGTVTLSTFMGSYQYYQVMVGNMEIQITDYNPVNRRIYEVGEKAYLDFDPKGVYIL